MYGLFVLSLPTLTQPWKFLRAPLGSAAALMGSIFLHPRTLGVCAEPQAGVRPPRRGPLAPYFCLCHFYPSDNVEQLNLCQGLVPGTQHQRRDKCQIRSDYAFTLPLPLFFLFVCSSSTSGSCQHETSHFPNASQFNLCQREPVL